MINFVDFPKKHKLISMISKLIVILLPVIFLASCGKKEEPAADQMNQKQPQQQPTAPETSKTDGTLKKEEIKKEEDKKKQEDETIKQEAEKKKKEDEMKKKEQEKNEVSNIDFSPIWAKKCVKCHGKDGKGKVEGVPDITLAETKSKSEKKLISIITNGVKAETEDGEDMPSWKGKLTEDEIKAAAKYVKGL